MSSSRAESSRTCDWADGSNLHSVECGQRGDLGCDAVLSIGTLKVGNEHYYLHTVAGGVEDYDVGRGEAPGRWLWSGWRVIRYSRLRRFVRALEVDARGTWRESRCLLLLGV